MKVLEKLILGEGSFRGILNETDFQYVTSQNQKLNHLLFMDDLKFYPKSERELNSLIQTVRIFSEDVGMVFGLDKSALLVLKRGKMVRTEGTELPDGKRMREINLDGYKYLGVLAVRFDHESRIKGKNEKRIHQKSKKVTQIKIKWRNSYSRDECMSSGYY